MSVSKGIGIPVKLLHEAEGHIVTVSRTVTTTFSFFPFLSHVSSSLHRLGFVLWRVIGFPLFCFVLFALFSTLKHLLPRRVLHCSRWVEQNNRHLTSFYFFFLVSFQIELKTGETFRGNLKDTEDNWNCQIENVTATARVRNTFFLSFLLSFFIMCLLSQTVSKHATPRPLRSNFCLFFCFRMAVSLT